VSAAALDTHFRNVYETDTAAVGCCRGATVSLQVGGKSHSRFGPPVPFPRAKVLALSDGNFVYDGPVCLTTMLLQLSAFVARLS
jgi:microcystin degradation protein MlrC